MYHSTFNLEQEAFDAFHKRHMKQLWRKVRHWGQSPNLYPYTQARLQASTKNQVDTGIQQIPVNRIVGSVSDNQYFDDQFNPRYNASEARWISLYVGFISGANIPPIEVYQVNEQYYVIDGHHRVSVARTLGQLTIDANVITVQ
ncbi:MAG: ParB/Srx family N-terminal domain-containing protein [Chloroflexota bacterium]